MSLGVIPLPDRPERIDGFVLKSSYDRLQAENAKLRELVADVREALCLDKTSLFREAIIKSLENDMRELGIEVES